MATIKLSTCIFISCLAVIQAAPRIIGGSDAPEGAYPFLVSLRIFNVHMCGGSIINNRWILTSAQCADDRFIDPDQIIVVAGTNKLNSGGKHYEVEYIKSHPEFSYVGLNTPDISLVRVSEDIEFTDKIRPIKLPVENFVKVNHPASFAGWGSIDNKRSKHENLQHIKLNVIDMESCKTSWRKMFPGEKTITDSHLCTFNKFGQGACGYDLGGPLVVDNVLIGFFSMTIPCALGEPDVFTRVYTYLNWISTEIEKYENHSLTTNFSNVVNPILL